MIRPIFVAVLIGVVIAAGLFISQIDGTVAIRWQDLRVDTTIPVLIAAIVGLAVGLYLIAVTLRVLIGGPRSFFRARRERRRRLGYQALTQGMVGVAAGDP
jgi:HemY protein